MEQLVLEVGGEAGTESEDLGQVPHLQFIIDVGEVGEVPGKVMVTLMNGGEFSLPSTDLVRVPEGLFPPFNQGFHIDDINGGSFALRLDLGERFSVEAGHGVGNLVLDSGAAGGSSDEAGR